MPKILYLSHRFNDETPLYGGVKNITITPDSRIKDGDTANTVFLKFNNHSGTHIDFPRHFSDLGKSSSDYGADFWEFRSIFVYDLDAKPGEIIDIDLDKVPIPNDTDFFILKSRFEQYRKQDLYWSDNPGVSPGLAFRLKQCCPNLRALGFDFISLTPQQNKPIGREAHRQFLLENDILIVEDMKLCELSSHTQISSLWCVPFGLDNADGAPVTVIAIIES